MPVHKSPSHWNINQCTAFDIYLPINVACLSAFSPVGRTLTLQFHHLLAKIAFVTAKQTQSFIGFSAVSGNMISAPKWNTVEVSCMWLNWPWREGKKWKSKRKQTMSSCGERRTALYRYSLGFGLRGGEKQCRVHPIGRKRIQELRGGLSREAFGPERHQHLSNAAETGSVQEPHQRSTCLQKVCSAGKLSTSSWWLWLDFSPLLPPHDLLL